MTTIELKDATYDGVDEFMARGVFDFKLVRAYDGDTVWAAIRHVRHNKEDDEGEEKGGVWRVCCRVLGIDAPEMPKSHSEAMSEYYRSAFASRDRLIQLLTDVDVPDPIHTKDASAPPTRRFADASGTPLPSLSDDDMQALLDARNQVVVRDGLILLDGKDKYGRYLARLKDKDGRDVAEIMTREGYAEPYDGGHRDPPPS